MDTKLSEEVSSSTDCNVGLYDETIEDYNCQILKLRDMEEEKKLVQKDLDLANKRIQEQLSDNHFLRETIQEANNKMEIIIQLEDEIRSLKSDNTEKEKLYQDQLLVWDMEKKRMLKDFKHNTDNLELRLKEESSEKQAAVESRLEELQRQNQELSQQLGAAALDKKREMDKLMKECEGKLRVANQERMEFQQIQRQLVNQEVMRKKMQHTESENRALRARVQVLEQQQAPDSTTGTAGNQGNFWRNNPRFSRQF